MTTKNQAQQQIKQLIDKYRTLNDSERKTTSEANVVHQFIDPLLAVLGWPIKDPARYKYELNTYAGRPDMTLIPESGGVVFVEAKRFGTIQTLRQARKTMAGVVTPGQLALPGMAVDRTAQEQQAINYAFQNGGTWAILTNFEKLRLFNARRDWLVLSFEEPRAYLDDFDLFWLLSYENVLNGRLDDLSNQRHREDVDATYLDFINHWRQRLAQDVLERPSQNPWAFDDKGQVRLAELRAVVQRVLDRLVVVRFAEDHLVIPSGTLLSIQELREKNPYTLPLSDSLRVLYEQFDHYHNSALFAPHPADQARFSDETLNGLVRKLYEARYRAMTPDIMGNTYEQYLGKTLVLNHVAGRNRIETADNLETRKKQGSYYTPQVIVRYLVDNSLGRYLYATANGRPEGDPLPGERRKTAVDIQTLRLIDPACGSGSFLIYAYQVLADFYRSEIQRIKAERTNLIYVQSESIVRFSPDSLSIMEFHSQKDYEIIEKIYDNWPLLGDDKGWGVSITTEFHMTSARGLFNQIEKGVPLYEGKMIHQFDAYFSTPRFWIEPHSLRHNHYRPSIRAIAANTNERTLISTILPGQVGAGNSLLVIPEMDSLSDALCLVSLFNSYVLDLVLRTKITNNVNIFYLYQLPVPHIMSDNPYFDAIVPRAARLTCTSAAFADLWQSVMATPWDESQAATDPSQRQQLRDELDAISAHLYGLSRADFAHILGTFPLVFPNDPAGEQKKESLLITYDTVALRLQKSGRLL
ncbi:MAG: DNA methyltransferase [Chloroflexota bacterium]